MTRRVALPEGQWADLVERLNHAQRQRIRFAPRAGLDNVTEGIAAMLTGWHVLDVNGAAIPVPPIPGPAGFPGDVLDTFPADVVDELATAVAEIVTGETVPKAGPGSSPGSPPEPAQPSMTASPMSTSLPTIPAGAGRTSRAPLPT